MNKHWIIFIAISSFLFLISCGGTKKAKVDLSKTYRFGFYNVENLFDTLNHPEKFDDDFTPYGKQKWYTERYFKKIKDLDRVISGMSYPALLGICEVENATVLQDMISNNGMEKHNYDFVHFESPDKRGIDCALLYQKDLFKVESSEFFRVDFPKDIAPDYTSRDIIYAKGIFLDKFQLHVFVNHWPSRRGGLAASEPKRLYVAKLLKVEINKILKADPDANILIVGDFNDEPDNNSIQKTLGAGPIGDKIQKDKLYNCMAKLDQQNKGTYNYRGNWNMLDNIITSGNLIKPDSEITVKNPTIYQESWMFYENPKYGKTPNRTYGGPNYYGGFSDHLPVFVEVEVQ